MSRLIMLVLLLLCIASTSYAFQYVVASDGIYFYDLSSIDRSWPRVDLSVAKCKTTDEPIYDSGGARGIITQKCFNAYSPVGYCKIRTYDYDFSLWQQVIPTQKTREGIIAICYRVYKK